MGGKAVEARASEQRNNRAKGAVASPSSDHRYLLKQSALLITNASQHLAHVVVNSMQAVEGLVALLASVIVGIRALWIEIPPIELGFRQGVDGLVDGIVCSSVAVAQIGEAGAVEVDSGNGCHGRGNEGVAAEQRNNTAQSSRSHYLLQSFTDRPKLIVFLLMTRITKHFQQVHVL